MYEEQNEDNTTIGCLDPEEYMKVMSKRYRQEMSAFSITAEMVEGDFGQMYLTEEERENTLCVINKLEYNLRKDHKLACEFFNKMGFYPDEDSLVTQ
jgi:hypothetical protein